MAVILDEWCRKYSSPLYSTFRLSSLIDDVAGRLQLSCHEVNYSVLSYVIARIELLGSKIRKIQLAKYPSKGKLVCFYKIEETKPEAIVAQPHLQTDLTWKVLVEWHWVMANIQ